MARYGWEIYKQNGEILTDDTFFNCYYLDHWQSDPGTSSGDTDSYTRSFPGYEYCEIRVIVGAGTMVDSRSELDVNITYSSAGVPTVSITETRGNTIGFGSTFWITVSRLDPRAGIVGDYGIALFDAAGGVAFPAGSVPMVYAGRTTPNTNGERTSHYYSEGVHYIETDSPIPPLVFWRINGTSFADYLMSGGGVRPSTTPASPGKYRWAVGVNGVAFRGGYFGNYVWPESYDGYAFVPGGTAPVQSGSYGISIHGDSNVFNLGDTQVLKVTDQAVEVSDFQLSGNDLKIPVRSAKSAMLPLWRFANWNNTGNSDFNQVRWKPMAGSGSHYLFGNQYRKYGPSQTETAPSYNADWYRQKVIANGLSTYAIDCYQYD